MKLQLWLSAPPQRKSWLRLCKLSHKFTALHLWLWWTLRSHEKKQNLQLDTFPGLKNYQNYFAAGSSPRTPPVELAALPQTRSCEGEGRIDGSWQVLQLRCQIEKLQNLSHLNCGLQIRQIWIRLITASGNSLVSFFLNTVYWNNDYYLYSVKLSPGGDGGDPKQVA